METVFAKLKPTDRFTIPGPNPEIVYTKLTPRTYRDQPDSWIYEVPARKRDKMVVVKVPS